MEYNPDVVLSERSGHALAGLLRWLAGGSSDRIGITVSCPVHEVRLGSGLLGAAHHNQLRHDTCPQERQRQEPE